MSTIVPDEFTAEEGAAIPGAQAKKKKKKSNKKKKAANEDTGLFRYRLTDIPKVIDVDNETKEPMTLTTITGELVGRQVTEDQFVYLTKTRPDLRYGPEDRPNPSIRSGTVNEAGNGKPLKNEFQTISTINIFCKTPWRPGNALRDAAPTDGFYIDSEIVKAVTNIKPEQDVPRAQKLSAKTQGKQKVLSEKAQGKQKVREHH